MQYLKNRVASIGKKADLTQLRDEIFYGQSSYFNVRIRLNAQIATSVFIIILSESLKPKPASNMMNKPAFFQ